MINFVNGGGRVVLNREKNFFKIWRGESLSLPFLCQIE
nr:MAG TPA: hypothetical protein [Caudoviricetes sp.]